jgi:hypothetical protein
MSRGQWQTGSDQAASLADSWAAMTL